MKSCNLSYYVYLLRLVVFLDVVHILNRRMYIPCSGWYFLWTFFFVEQYMHLEYFIRKSRQIWEKMAASFIHEILLIASDRWWSVVTWTEGMIVSPTRIILLIMFWYVCYIYVCYICTYLSLIHDILLIASDKSMTTLRNVLFDRNEDNIHS